ncbi:hypothetical protein [Acinetobacter towneri]|uniref:hypothetical protein n=1 Tax=Acinetobacter towneri TaxID=202956 RepID=UPI0034D605A7
MDLQKEREAFEALQNQKIFKWFEFDSSVNAYVLKDISATLEKLTALAELNYGWDMWQAAKAIPDGFVLVPRKSIEHWYLDEGEYLWMDEPDNWLCDMDVGDVQEVEHKEYIVTESNTLYATKIWDDENQDVSSWEFFNSKDDAEKAAEYCKAMIENQGQNHD